MSTKAHCALAKPNINANVLVKVLDVKPWDSFRSVLVRLAHQEKMPDALLFAILTGRNNCINNNTIEYYGFYNGLLLHCFRRRHTRHGSFQTELESEQNTEACSKSLLSVYPFPFEDLPLDVQRYCMQYLDFHHIIKLTQVSKNINKIASLPAFWETISCNFNHKLESEVILSISKASYVSAIKKLDLSLTKISSAALSEITSQCTNLKELILESCMDLTGGISPKCSQLEVLLLNGCIQFKQPLEFVFQPKNTTLKSLGLAHVHQLMNSPIFGFCLGLRHINLNYNRGAVSDETIAKCARLPNLEALQLNWCPNGTTNDSLASLCACTTLTMLEFAEGNVTAEIIKTLCQRNNFKKLHLQEVLSGYSSADIFNNSPQLESFYGVLQRGGYNFPETLKVLMANVMWPEMLQRLVDNCPHLECLILNDTTETKLQNDIISALKAGKLQNIRYLDIDRVAGTQIVTEVALHCPNLEYLILTEKADVSLEQLQLVQERCKNLREVSVKWRDEFSVLSYKFQGVHVQKLE
jgi:hypothetical protein